MECFTLEQIKPLVIHKLRILGFQGVSGKSLLYNEQHRALYIHALESELLKLKSIKEQYVELLDTLKNQN